SAIIIPKPRPMAVRVTMSKGATGSCSEVFEMDIGKDIAYHIRRVWEKETAKFRDPEDPPTFTCPPRYTRLFSLAAAVNASGHWAAVPAPNSCCASFPTKRCSKKRWPVW